MQTTFESLQLRQPLLDVVRELGYQQPTPIQAQSIPVLLAGKDLIGQSKTGSGKTAAFSLPILQSIDVSFRSPQALILCPTRELSAQVAREIRKLARAHAGLAVLELVGGNPGRPQRDALQRGVHIVVGTPGRVLDHLGRGSLDDRALRMVVLDEADRMLDMGFGEEVNRILNGLPRERQTALFSATFPHEIEVMSERALTNPVRVTIDEPDEARLEIRQQRLDCGEREAEDKLHELCYLLHTNPHDSALVFCNYKASVSIIATALQRAGVSADRLDGDLEQFDRDQVLARFRNSSIRVLVATDVAGRGIDVEGLDLVINFELPQQPENYVHRIGRTGRAGQSGLAISMTSPRQAARIEEIEQLTGVPIETLDASEVGAHSTHELLAKLARDPIMETIMISGGRREKVRPGDILGALTGDAGGFTRADVGKIEIRDHMSYVAVRSEISRTAAERLNNGRIKARRFRATLVGPIGTHGSPSSPDIPRYDGDAE